MSVSIGDAGVVDDPRGFVEDEGPGPDALEIGRDDFRERLRGRPTYFCPRDQKRAG